MSVAPPPAPDDPPWRRIGDGMAEGIVWAILAGGYFCHGYATTPALRGAAAIVCAALGAWAIASFGPAERSDPKFAAPRRAFAAFAFVAAWAWIQTIPLPASLAEALSPGRRDIAASFRDAGLDPPALAPLALDPAAARAALGRLIAATLFFAGVAALVRRREAALRLFAGTGWIAAIEGVRGLAFYLAGEPRASGVAFNPNHHAALVLLGLAPFFARAILAMRFTPRFRDLPLFGGANPVLLPIAFGIVALAGWSAALSRGSFVAGGAVATIWIAIEFVAERRERFAGEPAAVSRLPGAVGALAFAGAFVGLVLAGSTAERFARRSGELATEARPELWSAALRGLGETPWTGLGLGGTMHSLDRGARLPLETLPIHAHNDPVEWLADLGVPAFAIALALTLRAALAWNADARRRRTETPWAARLAGRAALASVALGLAHSATDFPLRVPWIAYAFLIQLALALHPGPLIRATIAPVGTRRRKRG